MNVEPVVSQNTVATTPFPTRPVAGVQQLLVALADPVRLEMVRRLMNARAPMPCGRLYDGINKSTATHHFTTLREVGLIERLVVEGHTLQRLRVEEVGAAVPGLLDAIVAKANGEADARDS